MKVLVTGGAGYIGSTICAALKDKGHTPIIIDSLKTGRIEFTKNYIFYKGDIADKNIVERVFCDYPDINYVIHCAALIIVSDSVDDPYSYYYENVAKSLELFKTLNELGCKNIVFSSSASIYDDVPGFMVTESSHQNPRSPYARTKYMMEMVLEDFCKAYGMRGVSLRYFNPIGADPLMRSGVHIEFPSHVLGKLIEAARSNKAVFNITGTEWDTRDGSGIRDYIHVWDLAKAHVKAVERFSELFIDFCGAPFIAINLGTGKGVTVKELVGAFETVFGKAINKVETASRPGDVAGSFANADTAERLLGWKAAMSIEDGVKDALIWAEKRKTVLSWN